MNPYDFLNRTDIPMEKTWMKVKEVAAYLQISKDLIYRWAQEGRIPVSKLGSQWRFNRQEIDDWARAQRPFPQKARSGRNVHRFRRK